MRAFAAVCEAVAATTKKTEKVRRVAEYFRSAADDAAQAAIFLSGRPFPQWDERTLQTGGALLWRSVAKISGRNEADLRAVYRRHGDLGAAAEEVLSDVAPAKSSLSLRGVATAFGELAQTSSAAEKSRLVEDLLRRATALEAKYIIKIIGGDLRIGLRESLVEEAVAQAFDEKLSEVQRANMLLGDIGGTLRLAAAHQLSSTEIKTRLFHPLGFMLASPAADAEEALSYFPRAAVEDKYDGIRAQAHCGGKNDPLVRIFSRTLDEISQSFPELPPALRAFPEPVILDGEVLAWDQSANQALPFSALQKRLGRKQVPEELIREVPVVYAVFDVLYRAGTLLIDQTLDERRRNLEQLFASVPEHGFEVEAALAAGNRQAKLAFSPIAGAAPGPPRVILAPLVTVESPERLSELFDQARARGNEGLMVKDPASAYTPGRRGKAWLKLKREMATLDVVVTAVEWGHGKRVGVLSDYTFAVRDGDQLLNVGKAYSGLTDAEIAEMTQWFLAHTVEDLGFRRVVEPKIVLEVAFNNMMRSDRHASGFALRFPRIVRIRTDKPVEEIDTLETVRKLYEKQRVEVGKIERQSTKERS
ncbi:MAG TPA: ATP-dependent DNA ligase [Candidatus Angelobacter sp.]|nr:ATP-dependent DNA ligase [Candidatus Angelobacter sp.]